MIINAALLWVCHNNAGAVSGTPYVQIYGHNLCPLLDMAKNRHKPSFTRQGSPQDTSALLSFVDWRRRRLGKIVDSAHFICRHSLNRNGSICKS